jgi:hypothetical protein
MFLGDFRIYRGAHPEARNWIDLERSNFNVRPIQCYACAVDLTSSTWGLDSPSNRMSTLPPSRQPKAFQARRLISQSSLTPGSLISTMAFFTGPFITLLFPCR